MTAEAVALEPVKDECFKLLELYINPSHLALV